MKKSFKSELNHVENDLPLDETLIVTRHFKMIWLISFLFLKIPFVAYIKVRNHWKIVLVK